MATLIEWTTETEASTKAQRHALYRMGLSRWYVHRFLKTKQAAGHEIEQRLERFAELKENEYVPVANHGKSA